jgi:hypothetical protein
MTIKIQYNKVQCCNSVNVDTMFKQNKINNLQKCCIKYSVKNATKKGEILVDRGFQLADTSQQFEARQSI